MAKFLLIVSILVSLLTASLGFLNKNQLEFLQREALIAKGSLATKEESLYSLQKKMLEMQKQLTAQTATLQQSSSALLTAQNTSAKTAAQLAEVTAQLSTKETQIQELKTQLTAQDAKRQLLQETASSTPRSSTERIAQLAEQKAVVIKLQNQLASAQAQIQRYQKQEAEQQQKSQFRKGVEGKVLAVNSEWNFVVLSLGEQSGIVNNSEMVVKRGSQCVGKVRITSVDPSHSLADIIPSSLTKGHCVRPGDTVVYPSNI